MTHDRKRWLYLARFPFYLTVDVVNGRRAIFLALFMATVRIL